MKTWCQDKFIYQTNKATYYLKIVRSVAQHHGHKDFLEFLEMLIAEL